MKRRLATVLILAGCVVLGLSWPGLGQAGGGADGDAAESSSEPRDETAVDGAGEDGGEAARSAESVLQEMRELRDGETSLPASSGPSLPASEEDRTIAPDSPLAGVAPGGANKRLQREGSFVIRRRGRLVEAAGGATPWMFTFEADKDGMEDPPMYLMPCGLLERMERVQKESDASVSFIVTGQVFVYRGANYLLPTVMRMAPRRGNLAE